MFTMNQQPPIPTPRDLEPFFDAAAKLKTDLEQRLARTQALAA
jgi:hypothetical protein